MNQQRNASSTELNRGDFQARYEPNFAWVNAVAAYALLPQGAGFWPTSSVHENGDCHDLDGHGFPAVYNGAPTYNLNGLVPYCDFTPGTVDYLAVADRAEIDIIGTEAFVAASLRGMSMSCWVWFDTLGALYGVMSKWIVVGNQRAYRLFKTAGDALQFDISSTGANTFTVTGPTIVANTWYHIICRFTPSTELMMQVNGVRYTNVVAIPAAINNSTAALAFGRTDGANYLDGRMSMMKLMRVALPSVLCNEMFWQTCAMFGVSP